jgi:hypothetical protein
VEKYCLWCDEYTWDITEDNERGIYIKMGREAHIFPLQTLQSMAERWGVSRQNVAAWAKRHDDFPKELAGIIEQTSKTPKVYPLYAVEQYEQMRGLVK